MLNFLEQSVDILTLGARELGALRLLKVKNIKEFINLELNRDLMPRGYGYITYKSLQKIQKKLLQNEQNYDKENTCNTKQLFADITKTINFRTEYILERLGVDTAQKLRDLTDQEIMDCKGAGRRVLSEIKRIQKKYGNNRQTSIDQQNNLAYSPEITSVISNLSVRGSRLLNILGIHSIEDFCKITKEDIKKTPTFGIGTWEEIKVFQQKYNHIIPACTIDWLNTPASEKTIRTLPLFSNRQLDVSDIDLHSSYLPYLKVKDIQLVDRLSPYLKQMAIKTVGELLLCPGEKFLRLRGFGKHKLDELKRTVYYFLVSKIEKKEAGYEKKIFADITKTISIRTQHTFEHLEINTAQQLLNLTDQEIMNCRGAGRKVLSEVKRIQKEYEHLNFIPAIDWLNTPASRETIKALPLFSNRPLQITDRELHPSYLPSIKVSNITFPARAAALFRTMKIKTIGELLVVTPNMLVKKVNFSYRTLRKVRETIEKTILDSDEIKISCSGFREAIIDYLKIGLTDNERVIAEYRLGLHGKSKVTFKNIGRTLGISESRVSQICQPLWTKLFTPDRLRYLDIIWDTIDKALYFSGGVLGFSDLAKKINDTIRIDLQNDLIVLQNMIKNHPDYDVRGSCLFDKDHPCNYCSALQSAINETMANHRIQEIQKMISGIELLCQNSNCKLFENPEMSFTASRIEQTIDKDQVLSTKYVCDKNELYSMDWWHICHGNVSKAVELLLKQAGKPLHLTEIVAKLSKLRKNVSSSTVYGTLKSSTNCLCWDRGTYLHSSLAKYDINLILEIENWIEDELVKKPFIYVHGAFEHFRNKCVMNNINSTSALYTALRKNNVTNLNVKKYPILSKGDKVIYLNGFFEDYVIENGGEILVKDLVNFVQKLFITEARLHALLHNTPVLLHSDKKMIVHLDNIDMKKAKFQQLCQYAKNILDTKHTMSVRKIYDTKIISCRLLGITGPRLLYSCFQNFGQDYIAIGRYPLLKSLNKKDIKDLNIRKELEEYIKQYGPCSREQLIEQFVEQAGYSENSINIIPYYSDNILLYASSCYIHTETLGWNKNQQKQLSQLLHDVYFEKTNTGGYYARLKDIYDFEYDKLPEILGNFPWTLMLLRSLTERLKEFKFIGNAKDAYIEVNAAVTIKSLPDLIYDLLYQEYEGAANKEELEERLVNKGIIRKQLTPNMISDSSKLVINGNNVIAKDLISDV